MLSEMRVVVGLPGSMMADAVFEPFSINRCSEPPFDLLVLDRAEELTETDFVHLAKLARRWVLAGNVVTPFEKTAPGKPSRNGHSRNGRSPELPFTTRLAAILDREKWTLESDRLVCRFAHLPPEERRRMTCEPLLDRPEIELRFSTANGGEPILVEVAFPAATSIAEAKSFLYHQLGEVLIRPCGAFCWQSTATTVTAKWPAVEPAQASCNGVDGSESATWIDLEPGVREKVCGAGVAVFTAAVAFDLSAGWDLEKAKSWLTERLPTSCTSRFASIPRR